MPTIVLADDHPVVRMGLRLMIEAERFCHVVGEASDGLEAVAVVEKAMPDILILDLLMPGLNGLGVIQEIRPRCPRTRVIVFSMHTNQDYVIEAVRSGARAYVRKASDSAEMLQAIRDVMAGKFYFSAPFTEEMLAPYALRPAEPDADPYLQLTDREREIFHLVAEGLSNLQIAERLVISPRTVEGHRSRAMRKLKLHTQSDVVRYAIRRELVPPE